MEDPGQTVVELPREGLPGLEPDRTLTDWGRSERLTGLADATVGHFLYHYWFRVTVEGIEHVPARGGALLVANRAGQLPLDGAMIARAVREEHPAPRPVHLAATQTYPNLPGVGMAYTKLGVVPSHPANLHRLLLDERELVLSFPEGEAGARKSLRRRYRLGEFDGVAFAAAAIRARVPIVPVAVLGSEEALPSLGPLAGLGARLGLPVGLGLPLPAKLHLRFLAPISTDAPGKAPDRAERLTEEVRTLIQENLFELLAARRSVWLG